MESHFRISRELKNGETPTQNAIKILKSLTCDEPNCGKIPFNIKADDNGVRAEFCHESLRVKADRELNGPKHSGQ